MLKCAICHREKTKTNHWWTLEYHLETRSFIEQPFGISARIYDFLESHPTDTIVIHICGIEHLVYAESKIRHGQKPERLVVE